MIMKDYKKILEGVVNIINDTEETDIGFDDICAYIDENCPELKESEDKKISLEIRNFIWGYPDKLPERDKWLAWFEKQWKKESDPRYKCLEGLLEADAIYQMSMNELMVEEAKSKAVNALSELAISKLLDLEKQGEKEYTLKSFKDKDIHKFMQYIEKQAKAYEFNLPNRGYDIYGFAKDILYWLEKQGKKQPIIVWHSINEEPEEMKELFCEWESDDATWHDVAFYDKESHTFRHAKMPINVTKWIYVDELLEKQGEQKPNDKVEPRFKVGDWCIDNEDGVIFQIVKVLDNTYTYRTNEGKEYSCTHYSLENDVRLWTIQDAKRGDILVDDYDNVLIYEEPSTNTHFHSYCYNNEKTFISQGGSHLIKGTHPATKEQRDMLFQKMKETDWTWDSVTKELKRITKFKIGDKVHCGDESQPVTIIDITNDSYITDSMIGPILFSEEDNWTLIKHKFNVGDWIISNNGVLFKIISLNDNLECYTAIDNENEKANILYYFEDDYHLWSIDDAKDGDVLCYETKDDFIIFIYKCGHIHYHCCYSNGHLTPIDSFFIVPKYLLCYIKPATKEQRDLLFKEMNNMNNSIVEKKYDY